MASAGGLSRDAYLGIGAGLVFICAGFVSVRCMMAIKKEKKLSIDDYLSIAGLLFVTASFAINDVIFRKFVDPTSSPSWLAKMAIVITIIINFALWASKAPIIFVYIKIFGIRPWLRYTCYFTLVGTALLYFGASVPTFVDCRGYETEMTPQALGVCVKGTTLTGVIIGFSALVADAIIFVLPIPPIVGLHLAPRKKIAVAVVFCTGILGIAASIVSLYYKWSANNGQRSDTLTAMLCVVVEGTVAINVGCAPALKSFWSSFISRSQYSTKASQSSMYPNGSRSRRINHVDSSKQSIDECILMEANKSANPSVHTEHTNPVHQPGW